VVLLLVSLNTYRCILRHLLLQYSRHSSITRDGGPPSAHTEVPAAVIAAVFQFTNAGKDLKGDGSEQGLNKALEWCGLATLVPLG